MEWTLDNIPDLSGKIMIVTGASSGLGYECAKELARKGAKVIMACRNMNKAEKVRTQIREEIPHADLDIIKVDVASLKSVDEFVNTFRQKYTRLDVLINNAGIMAAPYALSPEGYENHFATNYLGHFALTGKLLDILEKTPGSRVVSVSSIAYFLGNHIDFDTISYVDEKKYGKWHAYGRSKMECLLFSYEMDRRLKKAGKDIIAVAAHPGIARSNIMPAQAKNELSRKFLTLFSHVFKPTIYGAMPVLRAAADPDVHGGEYYGPSRHKLPDIVRSNKASHNKETAEHLWHISEELSGTYYLD